MKLRRLNPEEVRETILPPMVSKIFCDQKKIIPFWIDTVGKQVTADSQVSNTAYFTVKLYEV